MNKEILRTKMLLIDTAQRDNYLKEVIINSHQVLYHSYEITQNMIRFYENDADRLHNVIADEWLIDDVVYLENIVQYHERVDG